MIVVVVVVAGVYLKYWHLLTMVPFDLIYVLLVRLVRMMNYLSKLILIMKDFLITGKQNHLKLKYKYNIYYYYYLYFLKNFKIIKY